MNTPLQNQTVLAGRILLGLIFVLSGFGKITGFEGAAAYIASKNLPLPQLVAVLTIGVEVGGGLALLAGFMTRRAALGLAVFTVLAALIFHNFWAAPAAEFVNQFVNFMKNVSIAGGMLVLAAFGPGAISLDAVRGRRLTRLVPSAAR
jgi:putative oxidoreductase